MAVKHRINIMRILKGAVRGRNLPTMGSGFAHVYMWRTYDIDIMVYVSILYYYRKISTYTTVPLQSNNITNKVIPVISLTEYLEGNKRCQDTLIDLVRE